MSRNASILIFEEILKELLLFILESSFKWVRDTRSMLISGAISTVVESKSSVGMAEMVQFAIQVLNGSFFCLKSLDGESDLVPGILAAVLVIDWEYRMGRSNENPSDTETTIACKARLDFGESVHVFCCNRRSQFQNTLNIENLKRLQSILVQCIRSAIFTEDKLNTENITSLCCLWMLEVIDIFCQDQFEEQDLLNQLISKSDTWPLWIVPDFSSAVQLDLKNASIPGYVSAFDFEIILKCFTNFTRRNTTFLHKTITYISLYLLDLML